jgi:hypothetical protein
MAIAAHDRTPRSYVDPNYKFPLPEEADFAAHIRTYGPSCATQSSSPHMPR